MTNTEGVDSAVKRETYGLGYDTISPSVYSPVVGTRKAGLDMDDAGYTGIFSNCPD